MAYCKNCGKKIPFLRKCDCTATEKTVKSSKGGLAILVFFAALIIGIVIGIYLSGSGTKGTVKKYVKAAYSKKGGKTFYSMTMPDDAIKALKAKDKYDDKVDAYNDMIEDMIDDMEKKETVPKFEKIISKKKLQKSELKKGEEYFERLAEKYGAEDSDIKITKGYQIKFRTKKKDEDGDYKYEKFTICLLKVRGEGWKIAPMAAGSLE